MNKLMEGLKKIRKRGSSEKTVWDYSEERWVILPAGMPADDVTALWILPQTEGYRAAYQVRRSLGWTPFQAFHDIHQYIMKWHKAKEEEE